jgi:alpha-L-fucosidase 2
MKVKILTFLSALIGIIVGASAQTLPEFSTEENPAWYYVDFTTGNNNLQDNGAGQNLTVATDAVSDYQKWQFIGDEDEFIMRSKAGEYVGFASSRFNAVADISSAQKMSMIVNGTNFEIGRKGVSNRMNQWGGAYSGAQLGEYNVGDKNNLVTFAAAEPILPRFSSSVEPSDDDEWYYIQFLKSGNTIASKGTTGQNCVQAVIARDDAQLWKLVGTQDKFQLVNRLGEYASVGSSGMLISSTTEYSDGFGLEVTTNTNYPIGWEIRKGTTSSYMNQWSGTSIGNYIGFYYKGDNNNPLQFVKMDAVKHTEYDISGADSFSPEKQLTLWYKTPATSNGVANAWMEYSLPIGNGQLGASIYGNLLYEEIQFNEKTLWTGTPNDITGTAYYGQYKNFGSIKVEDKCNGLGFTATDGVKNYVRYLDIERGVAGVNYSNADGSTQYERKYISSFPDQVIAVRYKAIGNNKLTLCFKATPGDGINASAVTYADGYASFGGKLSTVTYRAQFRVVPIGDDAVMTTSDKEGINVRNADEVLLILAAATDFCATEPTRIANTDQLADNLQARIDAAASKGWDAIFADHVTDFTGYMGRVSLQLGDAASSLPTDQLVQNYNNSANNVTGEEPDVLFLEQLYFAYGRYLEISSSRGIDVPSNLQGIWNNLSYAPWNCDIHSNINVQMNYWPAESTNLSDMHMPFLNYIINNAQSDNWKRAATTYGKVTDGWTCFTENNIFGGMSNWGTNYFVANAWYCSHLWQHYLYTLDKTFLTRAFPAMWSCAQFWMERMIKDRVVEDDSYVCPDEYSPEQDAHNKEDATAHSQQLVSYLLDSVKKAIDILGQDACSLTVDDVAQLDDYVAKVDRGLHVEEFKGESWADWGTQNGICVGDSLLREWKYATYDVSSDKGHRHMSHLMALFPLDQINSDSEYFKPAVNSLKLRGDAATGWSMGWKVNLWARAHDGDHAHIILKNALKHSTAYGTNQYAGGIYYNLYDSHAPFQIDGNFGVCSGIAEMLMQSHSNRIDLLPALPSVWQNGEITGLKAIGDFTVDISWKDNILSAVTIVSNQGEPLFITNKDIIHCHIAKNGVDITEATNTDPTEGDNGDGEDNSQTSAAGPRRVKIQNDRVTTTEIETTPGDVITLTYDADFTNGIELGTSRINDVATQQVAVDVVNRDLIISGKAICNVKVYDLQGREFLSTKASRVTIPQSAGNIVVAVITDYDGAVTINKLSMR